MMGKGDKKSKKGKIFSKSHGKSRPKPQNLRRQKKQSPEVENKPTKE
jgi:ribosomal small subunit protein bTHX